jgi:hypothetical protein
MTPRKRIALYPCTIKSRAPDADERLINGATAGQATHFNVGSKTGGCASKEQATPIFFGASTPAEQLAPSSTEKSSRHPQGLLPRLVPTANLSHITPQSHGYRRLSGIQYPMSEAPMWARCSRKIAICPARCVEGPNWLSPTFTKHVNTRGRSGRLTRLEFSSSGITGLSTPPEVLNYSGSRIW